MMTTDFLVERLQRELAGPGPLPSPGVAPSLSYGRHRGPAKDTARVAAVAVTLYQLPTGVWMIPLTLRPRGLQHHAGQVCLPGGQLEPQEEIYAAAMREFEEELGLEADVIHRCGELSSQYVYASHNVVHPVVAIIRAPSQPWQPDPAEVEEVIPVPLQVLLEENSQVDLVLRRPVRSNQKVVDELVFRAKAFRYGDHVIWGATALILDQLARILRPG